jgi:hypothetical protein
MARILSTYADEFGVWHARVEAPNAATARRAGGRAIRAELAAREPYLAPRLVYDVELVGPYYLITERAAAHAARLGLPRPTRA